MLQITIKDTKSNEVIYDEQVSFIVMQAAEGDGTRSIRHKTEDASANDIMGCINAVRKEAAEILELLANTVDEALDAVCSDEDNDE